MKMTHGKSKWLIKSLKTAVLSLLVAAVVANLEFSNWLNRNSKTWFLVEACAFTHVAAANVEGDTIFEAIAC